MKKRMYRGLTVCQTLQDFLFTYYLDPSARHFKFREEPWKGYGTNNSSGGDGSSGDSIGARGGTTNSREKSHSPEHRGERSGPLICNYCDKPGHKADRCYSNLNQNAQM